MLDDPVAPALLRRARADQVAMLYRQWHRTTATMAFGALVFGLVLWDQVPASAWGAWVLAIALNQAWRGGLARLYRRASPPPSSAARWGGYWAIGAGLAGALWGAAAVAMFPQSQAHQALLVVCLFGVILGGLYLTAVHKPSFYGFVLPALVPLVVRVALEGDEVHLSIALVMTVVLGFVLAYGHRLNDLLTRSLAMRYENLDLIGELQAQTAAAESARAEAERASRAKSQFLAAASHDLRQPLHAMGLFAATLRLKSREPAVQALVTSIHASVEALETLFEQLLDLSRLEAGALQAQRSAVPLQPLFERLHFDFAPEAQARGLRLRFVATSLAVDSDPLLLARILRNLIANALRYTPVGGVAIGARRRRSCVRVDVVDTGVGIAAADRERVFEEFVQVGDTPRRASDGRGLGLGLAIVRRLAGLLAHPLDLVSVPGLGSRFSVTLPRVSAPPRTFAVAEPAAADDTLADDRPFTGRHVVVIDDDTAVVAAMQALFTAWGATVVGAADARRAWREACRVGCSRSIDLVVADLRLAGGASGIRAVEALRRATATPIPALVASGDIGESARQESANAGIRLLRKPVLASVLLAAALRACRHDVAAIDDEPVEPDGKRGGLGLRCDA